MRELFETVEKWQGEGHRLALATVVAARRSSPRPVGSTMVVRQDGEVWGSVSGGCVETAVIEASIDTALTDMAVRLEFGTVEPGQLFEVGLSCGGEISVFVERCPSQVPQSREAWCRASELSEQGVGFVWSTSLVALPRHAVLPVTEIGSWPKDVRSAYERRHSEIVQQQGESVFLKVCRPKERLIIVGGVHVAIALVSFARQLGFETVVIEPREAFASMDRFPEPPDQLLTDWPSSVMDAVGIHDDTFVVMLTHDPKIDDDALRTALRSPARYIGALGGKSTHGQRRERLLGEGFREEDLDRIHGPVGLDIGALTPEEIALSILAEIVKVRRAP